MRNKFIVITSINDLTEGVKKFAEVDGWQVIIVGDRKSPNLDRHPYPNVTFLSVSEQAKLGFQTYDILPFDHYARKNLGYLYAMREGAQLIGDTDDDNIPYMHWGEQIATNVTSMEFVNGPKVVNIYRLFSNKHIWPRGFPLARVLDQSEIQMSEGKNGKIAIWQGLADEDPDVDAIYRLVQGDSVRFDQRNPVALAKGVYCPFNSQNTIWFPESFTYLYLPVYVTFRFTDILRGYVAQRGIWEKDSMLGFTSASVYQNRNKHNLMSDFMDEIPCYTQIDKIIELLSTTKLLGDASHDIYKLYEVLFQSGIINQQEIISIEMWIRDIEKLL